MTTAFRSLPVESITILRDERQRKELVGLEELAESIRTSGLIHPPLVDANFVLVAGERRFTACRDILGWTHITVQVSDREDIRDLRRIELEENVKRQDLTWKDHCNAVAEFHDLNVDEDPEWTAEDTAQALGASVGYVSQRRAVARELRAGNPMVAAADKFSVAYNIVQRQQERQAASEESRMEAMLAPKPKAEPTLPGEEPTDEHTPAPSTASIDSPFHHVDFSEYTHSGPKVNFLHCDFPYGVKAGKHAMGAAKKFGGYDDDPDVYWLLLEELAMRMDTMVASSAHMMFWFSMDFYQATLERLTGMGWTVNPFPLLWFKSDNSGILPDPKRGPRRNYETAFLCSRGDRPVVQAVSNTFAGPNTKHIHMSEKPIPMLRHFFRMFVDQYTVMLDPTMGSGNAVVAAEAMGAASAFGLERDQTFYENAVHAYTHGKYVLGD